MVGLNFFKKRRDSSKTPSKQNSKSIYDAIDPDILARSVNQGTKFSSCKEKGSKKDLESTFTFHFHPMDTMNFGTKPTNEPNAKMESKASNLNYINKKSESTTDTISSFSRPKVQHSLAPPLVQLDSESARHIDCFFSALRS
ncbi:MAG: hypothetical protein MHMPM18_000584 [Marteilia pararefringens]